MTFGLSRRGKQRFAFADVAGRAHRPIEGERAMQLRVGVSSAILLNERFREPELVMRLLRYGNRLRESRRA